jgi:hypothetical protein
MKKIYIFFISFLIYFLFAGNGCNKRVYDSLISYNSPTPIIYETIKDSIRLNKFVGADLRYSSGNYHQEDLAMLRFTYNYVTSRKNTFSNTSLISYVGYYKIDGLAPKKENSFTDINFNGRKWGGGLLGNIKVGVNFNFTNFKLGSGIDFYAGVETGEFLDFRETAKAMGVIDSNRGWASANFNLFLFGAYKFKNLSILNLQLNLGSPGGISPILSYQNKENIYWISYSGIGGNVGFMTSLGSIF